MRRPKTRPSWRRIRLSNALFAVAEHPHEKAKDPPLMAPDQALERALVAGLPSGNQIAIGVDFEIFTGIRPDSGASRGRSVEGSTAGGTHLGILTPVRRIRF